MAPVGAGTPASGSSVTANTSTGASSTGGTFTRPTPLASTLNTPAGRGFPPAMAHSS